MKDLKSLSVGDPTESWARLGFVVDRRKCDIDGVTIDLGADGAGITGWALGTPAGSSPAHPNGVTSIDHLVVLTADLDAEIERYAEEGLDLRRIREAGGGRRQAFFRLGRPILEVVGPVPGPTRFWGLALSVADLDETAAFLGDLLHPPKPAVQRGRRIATLDKAAGSTVAIAFMSPVS
jgi:hypothetical protein